MVPGKVWLATMMLPGVAEACSCIQPQTLCSRLEPNMVAFIGRPVSQARIDKWRTQATFRIEEPLWGVPAAESIVVEGVDLRYRGEIGTPLFVLAGRRDSAPGQDAAYYIDFSCCIYGLVLPVNAPWVKEFREYVAQRKAARIGIHAWSHWMAIPGLSLHLDGREFSWSGISGTSPVDVTLPPGEYRLRVEGPHFAQVDGSGRMSILPGSCTAWRAPVDPTAVVSGTVPVDPDFYYLLEGSILVADESTLGAMRRYWHRWTGLGSNPDTWKWTHYMVKPGADGRFELHVLPGKYDMVAIRYKPVIRKPYKTVLASQIEVPVDGKVGPMPFRMPAK